MMRRCVAQEKGSRTSMRILDTLWTTWIILVQLVSTWIIGLLGDWFLWLLVTLAHVLSGVDGGLREFTPTPDIARKITERRRLAREHSHMASGSQVAVPPHSRWGGGNDEALKEAFFEGYDPNTFNFC